MRAGHDALCAVRALRALSCREVPVGDLGPEIVVIPKTPEVRALATRTSGVPVESTPLHVSRQWPRHPEATKIQDSERWPRPRPPSPDGSDGRGRRHQTVFTAPDRVGLGER